jgi:hypothetical protein
MRSLSPIYSMPSTKRALLVASPFDNLRGPERDVETMIKALQRNNFNEITTCVGTEATREGILRNWDELIHRTIPGDAIVFYYSGHGALVKPDGGNMANRAQSKTLQFIVPMDYDKGDTKVFKGHPRRRNVALSVADYEKDEKCHGHPRLLPLRSHGSEPEAWFSLFAKVPFRHPVP